MTFQIKIWKKLRLKLKKVKKEEKESVFVNYIYSYNYSIRKKIRKFKINYEIYDQDYNQKFEKFETHQTGEEMATTNDKIKILKSICPTQVTEVREGQL